MKLNLFPKIYRFIAEKHVLLGVISFIFCLIILFLEVKVVDEIHAASLLQGEREKLLSQRELWIDIARKYPTYKDAYFEIAVISYRLRDFSTASMYVKKAEALDPNSTATQTLEHLIHLEEIR